MIRKAFVVVLGLMMVGAATQPATDILDRTEATRRGVPVERIQLERAQERIRELEKQIAEMQASTSQPKPARNDGLKLIMAKLNSIPKNLQPMDGEQEIRANARQIWLNDLQKMTIGPIVFSGKLISVKQAKLAIPMAGRDRSIDEIKTKDGVEVAVELPPQSLWGKQVSMACAATLDMPPDDAMSWKAGDEITLTGKASGIQLQYSIAGPSVFFAVERAQRK